MTAEQAFLQLFRKLMPKVVSVTIGTVKSVDRENRTCDVERDEQPELFNCRLNAVIDDYDNYVVTYPTVGSYVVCISLFDDTDYFVMAYSSIDSVNIKVGKSEVKIDDKDIILNGGNLGGLVKLHDTVKKFNELEIQINTLKGIFSAWTPPIAPAIDNGLALKTAITAWAAQPMIPTIITDLENIKVKQ